MKIVTSFYQKYKAGDKNIETFIKYNPIDAIFINSCYHTQGDAGDKMRYDIVIVK